MLLADTSEGHAEHDQEGQPKCHSAKGSLCIHIDMRDPFAGQ